MSETNKGHRAVEVLRNRDGVTQAAADHVAVEMPVALVYNGVSHVVMMATPQDLEDFAVGFSLTEGIIEHTSEIYGLEQAHTDNGIELQLTISERCFQALKQWRRNMTGRTGCGLCGAESLAQAVRLPNPVTANGPVQSQAIVRAMEELPQWQPINRQTGAIHAAAWADMNGAIVDVREDVGRHNALDKLIGAIRQKEHRQPRPDGFLLITSRASYEMVQKAGWANMAVMAAVSAPTSLAVELAQKLNITLLGFARDDSFVCYANCCGVGE